jgi:hypothetical protein
MTVALMLYYSLSALEARDSTQRFFLHTACLIFCDVREPTCRESSQGLAIIATLPTILVARFPEFPPSESRACLPSLLR